MVISVARRAAAVLVCLFIFSNCGELEMMFSSNETYHVRTLVNDSSLEDCSILRLNDTIRPFFAVSVVNDPDLVGLLVYLQDFNGAIAGEIVQYSLLPYAGENAKKESDLQDEFNNEESDNTLTHDDETELPAYQIREQRSFADTRPTVKNIDKEIAVKSFAQDLPSFTLSGDLEIGPYILVFEVLGKKETLSRMETNVFYIGSAEFNLKDISMYLPGLSGQQLIPPGTVIMLDTSLAYDDGRFDPYVVWYNGKKIINEGKISENAGKFLWKTPEQAGFYSLRVEAFPFYLSRLDYTGISREITLPISPKAANTGYFFDSNQNFTARNPLPALTALFKTSDEEDLPASSPATELVQWYQFDYSLLSSVSASAKEQAIPVLDSNPQWAAVGQSYGLSIKPDGPYLLPPVRFFPNEEDQGGGILLLHIRPLSEGVILHVFFPPQSSVTRGAWMEIVKEGNVILLRLSTQDTFVDLPLYLPFSPAEKFLPIAIEFYIRPYRLEAKVYLDIYQSKAGEIQLPGALSGEGRIKLGGGIDTILEDKAAETYYAAQDSAEEISAPVPAAVEIYTDTVWDELAVLLSATPLLPEDLALTGAEKNTVSVYYTDTRFLDSMSAEGTATGNFAEVTVFSENF